MAYDPMFGFNTTQKKTLASIIPPAATPPGNATTTTAGLVKQAATVTAATVPFADLTEAANKFNELRTALRNAGIVA